METSERILNISFKDPPGVDVSTFLVSRTVGYARSEKMDASKMQTSVRFYTNYSSWNNITNMSAYNNIENEYFENIIKMGEEAVPFILEELEKGPTMLVYALARIRPNTIEPQSYIPLPVLCELWLQYLRQQ